MEEDKKMKIQEIEKLESDLEIEYEVSYTTFSTSYVDVDLLLKDKLIF